VEGNIKTNLRETGSNDANHIKRNILVVEDTQDLLLTVSNELQELGACVLLLLLLLLLLLFRYLLYARYSHLYT
jgi:hypothetical protein